MQVSSSDSPRPSALTRAGLFVRVATSLMVVALIAAGSLWGEDDDFPFGPFRMFSTTNKTNGPVVSTRLEAVRPDGTKFVIRDGDTGFRRAELEGQMRRFIQKPVLLGALAKAYEQRNPSKPPLWRIDVVARHYYLSDGSPTGRAKDHIVVSWTNAQVQA